MEESGHNEVLSSAEGATALGISQATGPSSLETLESSSRYALGSPTGKARINTIKAKLSGK